MKRPLALIILDGWGYSPKREGNAIALANTPNYDSISDQYPLTFLSASGRAIGMPEGGIGSSEMGHLTIGSGRAMSDLASRIDQSIANDEFLKNKVLLEAMKKAKNSSLHLIGLLSDGGIHSSQDHLFALLRMAKKQGVKNVFVHATLDGRDVAPDSAEIYVEALQIKMHDIGIGKIATLCGRQWTMDRSNRWGRTARAYTMLVHAEGERAFDAISAIRSNYLRKVTDEQIQPIVLESAPGEPVATVKNYDVVIFFNHRGERMKQLVKAIAFPDIEEFTALAKPRMHTVCLTEYDPGFNLPAAFSSKADSENTLAEVFDKNRILNCRIAESAKAQHVTQFFNGGSDKEFFSEQRIIIMSSNEAGPEPEMESFKITDRLLRSLEDDENDVYVVNFAAPDALAHSGNMEKTIEAVQHVDTCLGGIYRKIKELNGTMLITSDHGNCEEMIDGEGNLHSGHTGNPVPFHCISNAAKDITLKDGGSLADIAPTILGILGIKKPKEMSGNDLRINAI